MELYYVITVTERDRRDEVEDIYNSAGTSLTLTMLGRGTAKVEHLSLHGLQATEKAVMSTVASAEQVKQIIRTLKLKMFIDIPGNGIVMSVPLKSVGGGKTLAYLTDNKPVSGGKPNMEFTHEVIYVIYNEGYADDVMAAARAGGATGGTIINAKGSGAVPSEKFMGISLAKEKEVLITVDSADRKADIMRAIMEKAGPESKCGAICFSMPVSQVAGIRRVVDEDEKE